MEKKLQKLFKNASYQPESRLSSEVWSVLEFKSARVIKWKTFGYLGVSVLSLSGSIFSIKSLIEQFARLGFFDYFSLIFSDGGVIAKYWKEYTLTLADSLPVVSIAILFVLLFILFVSIRRAFYRPKNKLLIA